MISSEHGRDRLYYLDISGRAFTSVSSSPLHWHYRLDHPSLAKLRQVVPSLSYVSVLECEACQLGKHHRSSFPRRVESRQLQSFELVHTDIWGPSRVKNPKGFQYFVIFVDDCSRMTWLYLMKERSEFPHVLSTFYNEICVQFDKRIKILRSDNALEYTQSSVASFCADRGIIHQTSCVHTSQQNGVAERKHRHLLDVARTLMFNMHVPKQYWADVVLIACQGYRKRRRHQAAMLAAWCLTT
jgi:hypothetical protein